MVYVAATQAAAEPLFIQAAIHQWCKPQVSFFDTLNSFFCRLAIEVGYVVGDFYKLGNPQETTLVPTS